MYKHNRPVTRKKKRRPAFAMLFVMAFGVILIIATARSILSFPVIEGAANLELSAQQNDPVKISWPKYGQSAVGAVGFGVLEESDNKDPQPTASVAKVMTALAVLEKSPLQPDETGPIIKITAEDEALFGQYYAKNGTSVRLAEGTEINLYQALQYILIPSANNVADTTAKWAFGSLEEYSKYANDLARKWGMNDSDFADASGFSPQTTSTAHDLVLLGEKAMQNPVLAEIVRTWEIELPDGSKAQNSNVFLDFEGNGVIGIKTGDTDQAGGVYLTAANREVDGQTVTIVSAVMGAKTLTLAEQDAMKILKSSERGFSEQKVVSAGQAVGYYEIPWQGKIDAISEQDISALVWASQAPTAQVELKEISEILNSGDVVGQIKVANSTSDGPNNIKLTQTVISPSTGWRIRKYF